MDEPSGRDLPAGDGLAPQPSSGSRGVLALSIASSMILALVAGTYGVERKPVLAVAMLVLAVVAAVGGVVLYRRSRRQSEVKALVVRTTSRVVAGVYAVMVVIELVSVVLNVVEADWSDAARSGLFALLFAMLALYALRFSSRV